MAHTRGTLPLFQSNMGFNVTKHRKCELFVPKDLFIDIIFMDLLINIDKSEGQSCNLPKLKVIGLVQRVIINYLNLDNINKVHVC